MITFVLILTVLYAVGFCSLAVVFSCFAVLKLKDQNCQKESLKKESKLATLSEEQARELRRRQRELLNFLNFDGDVMPDVDDEEVG